MSPILFAKVITEGKPLKVFNRGKRRRNFTFVDDIVPGVARTLDHVAKSNPEWPGLNPDPVTSIAPWRINNIGNSQPVELRYYIKFIEKSLGKPTETKCLPLQPGDVEDAGADVAALTRDTGYKPNTPIELGSDKFADRLEGYYL